jgi:hypothetical protein
MKQILAIISTLYLANGLAMLIAPQLWYQLTPGVVETGAFNSHFIRDIGLAFIGASTQALLFLARYRKAFAIMAAPIIFIAGHGLFHLIEFVHHQPPLNEIISDMILVIIPSGLFCLLLIAQFKNKEEAQ